MTAYRRYIEKVIKYGQEVLCLQEYELKLSFDHAFDDTEEVVAARIRINDDYLQATIEIGKYCRELFDRGEAKYLASIIVHELCHILTEPLYLFACDGTAYNQRGFLESVREKQTQRITRLVMAYMPKSVWRIS